MNDYCEPGGAAFKYEIDLVLSLSRRPDPSGNLVMTILRSRSRYTEEARSFDRWADDGGRVVGEENPILSIALPTV